MSGKRELIERRYPKTGEIRLDGEESSPKITGYAAVFDQWADIGGWFKESVRKGAFKKTIKENDIRALWNHNESYVLGRNRSQTLTMSEDDNGLWVEIDPVPATWADDLIKSMRRGDVNQMSFGFIVNKEDVDVKANQRTLVDVTLFDVSVVTFPAYPTTTAQVRSMFIHETEAEVDEWAEFYRLAEKLQRGEELTSDELRTLRAYIPDPSVPAENHTDDGSLPAENHTESDTRKVDKFEALLKRAEYYIKTKQEEGI